jgi:hypothetical protein
MGYGTAATDAFKRAIERSWTMAEAMQVSDIARQKGYGTVAESAMRHAMELQ